MYLITSSPLSCLGFVLHERGTHQWLLVVPILGLQQTIGMRHFRALLRYRLCMQMFPDDFRCPSCQAPMDAFGDHALLGSCDSRLGGFQLCHSLVQRSLGIILRGAGIYHLVEPPHLRMERDDAPVSGRGSGLTRPANILLFSWRGDRHCCVNLVGVSPARSSWRQAAQALRLVEEAKGAKHAETCLTHGFDFAPFSFSVLRSLGPAAEEILTRVF